MTTNARFTVQHVSDPDDAVRFFTEILGFELQTDAPYGDGDRWIEANGTRSQQAHHPGGTGGLPRGPRAARTPTPD